MYPKRYLQVGLKCPKLFRFASVFFLNATADFTDFTDKTGIKILQTELNWNSFNFVSVMPFTFQDALFNCHWDYSRDSLKVKEKI